MSVRCVVGLSDPYTRSRVVKALQARPEYECVDEEDAGKAAAKLKNGVVWLEYEDLPFDALVHHMDTLLGNSYCIRKGLIRKSQMAYCIRKYTSKNSDSILKQAVPETYLFELDDPYYFEEAMSEVFEVAQELQENEDIEDAHLTKKWILKPSITNKGAEIFVFDRLDQLRNMFEERYERLCASDDDDNDDDDNDGGEEGGKGDAAEGEGEGEGEGDGAPKEKTGAAAGSISAATDGNLAHIREWVMQRYVANPLTLYGGRKFHIRTYVVSVGNIKVYVYREMLALFAADPYDDTDLSSRCHITNTCIQVDSPSFREEDSVRSFWSLAEVVPEAALERVFEGIKAVTSEVFRSVCHEVTVFQPMRNLFELYGLDFLVDSSYNVHFLEANAFPDFRQTGEQLSGLIDKLFQQTIGVALDPFFGIPPCPTPDMHLVLELALRAAAR
jgi:tubulin---tyrosine ligase